jgi:membrane-associated phospholipid phosphatase
MKYKITFFFVCLFTFLQVDLFSQTIVADSSRNNIADTAATVVVRNCEQAYDVSNDKTFIYTKPKYFGFITNLPHDAAGIVSTTFSRKSVKPLLEIAGATAVLLFADQAISDGVHQFSRNIHLHAEEDNKNVVSLKFGKKPISLIKAPNNINTGLYQLGEGFPSLLIGAGLYAFGKIHNDYRALSTASQLAEAFVLMGVGTQILKRVTGRQSPSNSTSNGGTWHFLPSFKQFQNNTPNYDAFPSGHLATMMSTVTILANNYPEKRYIKPVGYSLIGLVGLAMINNDVHWASDYPLALGLGYLCALQVAKNHRKIVRTSSIKKNKTSLAYSFNYSHGRLMPEVIYHF